MKHDPLPLIQMMNLFVIIKFTVPDRNVESLVAMTPGQDYLSKKGGD
jgi:hypothetical protein